MRLSADPSSLPALAAPKPKRDRTAAERVRRRRTKLLRELWSGRVRICSGPDSCAWREDIHVPCDCVPGRPCACERRFFHAIVKDAESRFGVHLGSLVASAILDVARAMHLREEDSIRQTRVKLIGVLLADQRQREALELRAKRLDMDAAQLKPPAMDLRTYLELKNREEGDAEKQEAGS